jgi:ankyrin repeat protein
LLIDRGAKVDFKDINGKTARDRADEAGHSEVALFLESVTGL